MKKFLLSFSLLFIVIGNLFAQSIPTDPNIRIGKLDNGMKYYIKKNTKPEKKVEFRLAIDAGALVEDDDQKGLAHFMEHMNFNGTKNFPDNISPSPACSALICSSRRTPACCIAAITVSASST